MENGELAGWSSWYTRKIFDSPESTILTVTQELVFGIQNLIYYIITNCIMISVARNIRKIVARSY
jgi:hypothetical protein